MQGLRSKNPAILPLDTEIERTIRQRPGDNIEEVEEELNIEDEMAEQHVKQPQPQRRPMKQSYIPDNPNQSSCIAYQPEAEGNYYISLQIPNLESYHMDYTLLCPHLVRLGSIFLWTLF